MIKAISNVLHRRGIAACESYAQFIGENSVVVSGGACNLGGGVSGSVRWPALPSIDALTIPGFDFNTQPIPLETASQQFVVCEQVIEHIHNTCWFIGEIARIIRPGGELLLSTENLASMPNVFALFMGKAPFSLQHMCGRFVGGWRDRWAGWVNEDVRPNDPAFSGVNGHNRVLTVGQIKSLMLMSGFNLLSKHGFSFNHYVLFHYQKT